VSRTSTGPSKRSSRIYTSDFFTEQRRGSLQSARAILPVVFETVPVRTLIDVGCGVGTWARAALDLGVADVLGIDGDYVDRDSLLIPSDRFTPADLVKPLDLGRRFDMAVCVEVAEHLPEHAARGFIAELTSLSDVVLFSAAIPYQGGTGHINEQWQSYWAALFAEHGYMHFDIVRPRVWPNAEVKYWYAQNVLLYVAEHRMTTIPLGERGATQLDLVHPRLYEYQNAPPQLRHLLEKLPGAARRCIHDQRERVTRRITGR
jgi:SAM-dependent methyltransferase